MPNNLSNQLLAQMFGQNSDDPFLTLVRLSHPSFDTIYLVNNTVDILSQGNIYRAFPMKVTLPPDDGETSREASITFSNVTLELIDELRSITDPLNVEMEMILASAPDTVQYSVNDLKLRNIKYNAQEIQGTLYLDNFLNTEMTSEQYTPENYPGIF